MTVMSHVRRARNLIPVVLAVVLAASLSVVSADHGTPETHGAGQLEVPPPPRDIKHPRLDSMLNQMVDKIGAVGVAEIAEAAPLSLDGAVAVAVRLDGDSSQIATYLESSGATIANVGVDYIEAYVPVTLLAGLSQQDGVLRVQTIIPPQPLVTSEGTTVHNSPVWNARGFTGAGVKVGVIDVGFLGYTALMGTELPTTVVARCYTAISTFTSDLADCDADDVHGTAVAEAIVDMAPDAALYVSNPSSPSDLQSAASWMVSQGVTVINHSVGWTFDGPGDGTSPLTNSPLTTVDDSVAAGVTWVNAAGNAALASWYGSYINQDLDGFLEFVTSSASEVNAVTLSAGDKLSVQLRWEDTWGGSARDFDLLLYDSGLNLVAVSENPQFGLSGHDPYEWLSYTAPSSGQYSLSIFHFAGAIPSWLQLNVFSKQPLSVAVATSSISNPAESANPGMLAVGAAYWATPSTIENFSSQGPTTNGRVKPDIVGADRGNSVSYGFGGFPGTSQASPHVAGMAALILEQFPSFTPTQIADYLKANALPRGAVPNNTWGYGLAHLPALSPGAPTDVSAIPGAGDGFAQVSWSAPAADGGSTVTGYTITSTPDGGSSILIGDTTAIVLGLSNGRSYSFTVAANNAVGQGPPSPPSNTVTPIPILSLESATAAAEGASGATPAQVVATLSAASVVPVTLQYDTSDGTATASSGDYAAVVDGSLTIPAGNVTGTIPISVFGDAVYEMDETFMVKLASSTESLINKASTTVVTISNDDPQPAWSVAGSTAPEGPSSTASVTVTLTGMSDLGAHVSFATADTSTFAAATASSDYTPTSGTVSFGPNTSTASTSTTVQVSILEDAIDELVEQLRVVLSSSMSSTIAVAEATVSITDNDPAPTLTIQDVTANENDGTATTAVTLSGASSAGVSVDVSTVDFASTAGQDYVSTTATLVWAPDETGAKSFSVPLIDDGDVEGPKIVTLLLSNERTNATSSEGVLVSDGIGTLKIIDDEAP